MCTRSFSERRALIWLLLAASLACSRPRESPEAYAARNAVVRYNQALVEAFRSSKATGLAGVASENEVSRNASVIAALTRQGRFMEARQMAFEVEATRLGPADQAELDADEAWTYEHRSLNGGAALPERKKARYRLTYRLKRPGQGGAWVVDQVVLRSGGR